MRLGVEASVVGGEIVMGDVDVDGDEVAGVGLAGPGSGVAVPGLVDLQVNGYAGIDVSSASPESLVEMGAALARDGVLAYQPTVITASVDDTCHALRAIGEAMGRRDRRGARILGAHLEGPFLSAVRAGAHPLGHLRNPSADLLARLLGEGCPVTTVTLAPELAGSEEVIDMLVARQIVVSLGHTDATADVAHAAFDRGARAVTHLFNAMRPFSHRDPGIAAAALARDDAVVMLIADGEHLERDALLLAWRAARHRLALVSDAISAAGMEDGIYAVGAVDVTVVDGVARTWDGALAGSARSLVSGVRRLAGLGVPLAEAVEAATGTPARLVGRSEHGGLRPGARADLVVLGEDLEITQVLVGGEPIDGR